MTHRGPFQPQTFCDSVGCCSLRAIKADDRAGYITAWLHHRLPSPHRHTDCRKAQSIYKIKACKGWLKLHFVSFPCSPGKSRRRPKEKQVVAQQTLPALSSAARALSEMPHWQGLAHLCSPPSSLQQRVGNLAKRNGQLGATLLGAAGWALASRSISLRLNAQARCRGLEIITNVQKECRSLRRKRCY